MTATRAGMASKAASPGLAEGTIGGFKGPHVCGGSCLGHGALQSASQRLCSLHVTLQLWLELLHTCSAEIPTTNWAGVWSWAAVSPELGLQCVLPNPNHGTNAEGHAGSWMQTACDSRSGWRSKKASRT